MDVVPLFAWKASQHAFFILRHHLFKHAKWPQVDIKIKVCMRNKQWHCQRFWEGLKNLDCGGMYQQSQEFWSQGMQSHAIWEKKIKNSLFVCVSFGLFINKVIVVGVEYNPILDEVLNWITYFPISFGSHTKTTCGSTWSVVEISFATISVGVLFLWKTLS